MDRRKGKKKRHKGVRSGRLGRREGGERFCPVDREEKRLPARGVQKKKDKELNRLRRNPQKKKKKGKGAGPRVVRRPQFHRGKTCKKKKNGKRYTETVPKT